MDSTTPVKKGDKAKPSLNMAPQDAAQRPRRGDQSRNSEKSKGGKGDRRNESREVQISKACSYILRHGAAKEGITMRRDGYLRVDDLLGRPKLKNLKCVLKDIQDIVANNDKQRFSLLFEPAASSSTTSLTPENPGELSSGAWWIRANQGHTVEVEDLAIVEIKQASDIPMAVHGTNMKAWALIKDTGLCRMQRNHIHMAKGMTGDSSVISGMRGSAAVFIFVDVDRAIASGIQFFVSANGVVLSPGDNQGFIPVSMFEKVLGKFGNDFKRWNGTTWVTDIPAHIDSTKVTVVGHQS